MFTIYNHYYSTQKRCAHQKRSIRKYLVYVPHIDTHLFMNWARYCLIKRNIQFKMSYDLARKYRYILQYNTTRCLWCWAFDEWIWKFGRIATMTPRWTFCIEQILIAQSYFCYIIALSQHREINLRDNTFCCAFASTQQVLI